MGFPEQGHSLGGLCCFTPQCSLCLQALARTCLLGRGNLPPLQAFLFGEASSHLLFSPQTQFITASCVSVHPSVTANSTTSSKGQGQRLFLSDIRCLGSTRHRVAAEGLPGSKDAIHCFTKGVDEVPWELWGEKLPAPGHTSYMTWESDLPSRSVSFLTCKMRNNSIYLVELLGSIN